MAVTTKMNIDVSGFKAGIQQAQQSVKTLDAELKRNEAQFKATGDKEKYMADQTKALNSKMQEQKTIIKNAEQALKAMDKEGIKPTDAAYQQMQRTLLAAETAVADITTRMDSLATSEGKAAGSADKLTGSLGSISTKVNLDAVISGVNSITKGLEDAARAAVSFARDAWGEIMEIASYADDIATKATIYGMTPTEYQAMANLAATWGETSVDAIMAARRRVWKNGRALAEEGIFGEIGINPYASTGGKYGTGMMKDWDDLFWESGAALMDMDPFLREEYAEKIFGRKWEELRPMFAMGRENYEAKKTEMEAATITDENIEALGILNDTVAELEQKFIALEGNIVGELAPALTLAAEAVGGLLDRLLEYLKTPEGQEMLDRLGSALTGLFEKLTAIDPETVVEGFVGVFDKIIGGLEWLFDHTEDVKNSLIGIVTAWGGLTLGSTVLKLIELVAGLKFLVGGGAAKATGGLLGKLGVGSALKGAAGAALPFLAADAAVISIAALPAAIAQWANEGRWVEDRERRLAAAEGAGENADFIRKMANALGPETDGAGNYVRNMFGFLNMRPTDTTYDLLMGLESRQNAERAKLFAMLDRYTPVTEGNSTKFLLQRYWAGEELDPVVVTALAQNVTDAMAAEAVGISNFEVAPDAGANIAEQISAQAPEVRIGARLVSVTLPNGQGGAGGGLDTVMMMHANGLPFVPYDGYLSVLHRGERVMTASENRHYTYNNNNYFGNVNLNNGMEIDALCDSIDRHNRRQNDGFGA